MIHTMIQSAQTVYPLLLFDVNRSSSAPLFAAALRDSILLLLILWCCYQCVLFLVSAVVETCSWFYDVIVIVMATDVLAFPIFVVVPAWNRSMTSLLTTSDMV